MLDTYSKTLKEKNYEYRLVEETKPYVLASKTYGSVNDYIKESVFFNDYFDEIKYTENGSIKRIETVGFNENNILKIISISEISGRLFFLDTSKT